MSILGIIIKTSDVKFRRRDPSLVLKIPQSKAVSIYAMCNSLACSRRICLGAFVLQELCAAVGVWLQRQSPTVQAAKRFLIPHPSPEQQN